MEEKHEYIGSKQEKKDKDKEIRDGCIDGCFKTLGCFAFVIIGIVLTLYLLFGV